MSCFMGETRNVFVTDQRRAWMRLRSHTVVFEREPEFQEYLRDPSGSVMTILRVWLAERAKGASVIRYYIGSVRHCECGGWTSIRELHRLFRQATITARLVGEKRPEFRARLSKVLRKHLHQMKRENRRCGRDRRSSISHAQH
jgi:hypothetical protein